MSMDYVRKTYGVPISRHQLVRRLTGPCKGATYRVYSCSQYVHVRDAKGNRLRFHPLDLEYKTTNGWIEGKRR